MKIFKDILKKQKEEPVIKEIPKDSGCRKCYNYNHALCHGKNGTCEAFKPNESERDV